jgi:DNA polymerase epsilon subunit 1
LLKTGKKFFRFKVSLPFRPYLYILIKPETLQETMAFLGKKYNGPLCSMEVVKKEDLVRPSKINALFI